MNNDIKSGGIKQRIILHGSINNTYINVRERGGRERERGRGGRGRDRDRGEIHVEESNTQTITHQMMLRRWQANMDRI